MPRLVYQRGIHHPESLYSGHGLSDVAPGSVVEVDQAVAERLLTDFPECWRLAPLASGDVDVLSALDGAISRLASRLDRGELDAHLDLLMAGELGGKARRGAIRVLRARAERLGVAGSGER